MLLDLQNFELNKLSLKKKIVSSIRYFVTMENKPRQADTEVAGDGLAECAASGPHSDLETLMKRKGSASRDCLLSLLVSLILMGSCDSNTKLGQSYHVETFRFSLCIYLKTQSYYIALAALELTPCRPG